MVFKCARFFASKGGIPGLLCFANEGYSVALADYDPQRSSLDWLERRPAKYPSIAPITAYDTGLKFAPRTADIVVIDAPARSHGAELTSLIRHAETIVVPVLPSTIDASARGSSKMSGRA